MKKLALTSLFAVFAVSGAHAANIIDGNPLYRPDQGRFYSVTTVGSNTENTKTVALNEEFAYGITKNLAVVLATNVSQTDWFDTADWGMTSFGLNYRAIDMGNWKGDLFGAYSVTPVWGDHASFLDEDNTDYVWTLGARAGYVSDNGWTVAGHIAFDYANTESFNWDDEGLHQLRLGLDGQVLLSSEWNLVAGVEYTTNTDNWDDKPGVWTGKVGVNYNIDETKFVGAYVGKEMSHEAEGKWKVQDGFAFGAKFGIDF